MILPKAIATLTKWAATAHWDYQLDAVRLRVGNGEAMAEATDGRRLARLTWNCNGPEAEYFLPAKALSAGLRAVKVQPDGYRASLNGDVTLMRSGVTRSVTPLEDANWPETDKVIEASPQHCVASLAPVTLRDEARRAIKGGEKSMLVRICRQEVRLNCKYVRDMAETAIRCGYDRVLAYAKDEKSCVHFAATSGDVAFESAIMPRAE